VTLHTDNSIFLEVVSMDAAVPTRAYDEHAYWEIS
jgi:hypothetical protein